MTLIVGIGHKARNGKDTAAEALLKYYDKTSFTCSQFRFAEALYEECRTIHGMTEKDAPLLQKVGAARRAENPNYWIDKVFDQIAQKPALDVALITDVRYQNEAKHIRDRGGRLINVVRLTANGSRYIADDRPANHPSEIELDDYVWDYDIFSHSVSFTQRRAIEIVEFLMMERRLNAFLAN